jgi:predicted O-methyltransferase YrrM
MIDELPGLVSPQAGRTLVAAAASIAPGQAIVELGSYKGKSACYLAHGGYTAPVYAVDAWSDKVQDWSRQIKSATLAEFEANVASVGLTDRITPVQDTTVGAAKSYAGPPVGLLFIDGDHAQKAALADFMAWRRHLANDAEIIWDDFGTRNNPGVGAAVARLLHGRMRFIDVAAGRLALCTWEPPLDEEW